MEGNSKEGGGSKQDKMKVDLVWKERGKSKLYGGALVGKLITDINMNKVTVIQMIRKGWYLSKKEDLEIIDVDQNAFIFEFRRKEDRVRVRRGRPWSIQGILLNIQPWMDSMVFSEVDFDRSPFRIQFHDLPPGVMEVENVMTLGSMMGEVVMIEDPRKDDLLIQSFLRARVIVDIRKPLITGMWTPRPDKDPVWIKARYECLQNYCFHYGKIGHDQRVCPGRKEEEDDTELKFGSWLSVFPARMIDEVLIECRGNWEENDEDRENQRRSYDNMKEEKGKSICKENSEEGNEYVNGKDEVGEKEREYSKELRSGLADGDKEEENKVEIYRGRGRGRKRGSGRNEGGRPESSGNNVDLSKAIVMYGSESPMSEVSASMTNVRLKSGGEKLVDDMASKRRRLSFDDAYEKIATRKFELQKKGGRRSVHAIKRQIRRGEEIRLEEVKVMGEGKENNAGLSLNSEGTERMWVEEEKAEGYGGWPKTATTEI